MSIPATNWYTKIYSQFRGADFSTDATNIADVRAADMENMVADEAGFPSKRVGWRELLNMGGGAVNGIHYMKYQKGCGVWFVHTGKQLLAIPHIQRMRNVLPDAEHMDVEYTKDFLPTQQHVDWLQSYVEGTATVTYEWQKKNADMNGDGIVDGEDVKLLQAMADNDMTADLEGTVYTVVSEALQNGPSVSFEHDGDLYLMDGNGYYVIHRLEADTEAGTDYYGRFELAQVTGYIPTTGVSGYYYYDEQNEKDPGTWMHCTEYEQRNLLAASCYNTMAGDGVHKDFWTTEKGTVDAVELLGADGEWTATTDYTAAEDGTRMKITFTTAPSQHQDGAGLDNIRVTLTPSRGLDGDVIRRCNIATRYGYFNDNRWFVTGNPDTPNRDYMSGVDDPTYFPEFGWTDIGGSYAAIQGYLHYGDVLAIVKEDTNVEPELYIRSCEVQSDQSVLFPVQQGIIGVGAASRFAFANLRDDALFYAREGVYAVVGTDASQRFTLQNRSFYVDARLRRESGKPVACVWQDKYLLCFPDTGNVYVADAKQQSGNDTGSIWYEWYFWTNIPACCCYEIDGALYFGTRDGRFCRFNDDWEDLHRYSDGACRTEDGWTDGEAIVAYWKTKADFLSGISETKSLSRRGCSLMLKPYTRSSVEAVVESEGLIVNQTVDVIGDAVISTVFPFERSVKRFSTIQMTFKNKELDEGFGIYGIQLRYAIDRLVR